ncbi:MAG: hypothetical protein M3R30_04305 [Candidatus Eremiobacteraeota bacterium]|nr:hypothetical protein [Candidatus Eremiobacteraeota bacterium]
MRNALCSLHGEIDCGDAAEVVELVLGLCAGSETSATLTGTTRETFEPTAAQLRAFGASVETTNGGLPIVVRGTREPQTRTFLLVNPSRRTSAALTLAARAAGIAVTVRGDKSYDDGAERLLSYLDATGARTIAIPRDFHEAATLLVDATTTPGESVRFESVGVNPLRTGLLDVLAAMGAPVTRENERSVCGSPVADLTARIAPLRGTTIAGDLLARSRPELDLIAHLAARALGETRILGRDLPDPAGTFERLPNGIAFPGLAADTVKVSETNARPPRCPIPPTSSDASPSIWRR